MSWEIMRADEFCDSVRDGTHDTPKQTEVGYKLVTGKHIKNSQIDTSDAYFISETDYERINERSLVEQWDVLMSMIGTVGEVAVVKTTPDYAIKNVALFKCGGSELKGKWLSYYLQSPNAKGHMIGHQKGSSQQFLSLKQLRSLPVPVTNESSMKKIVEALSQYDDLIENNQKQIKLLEEAAQRLYKEWFVDLRFPGYEDVEIVDSVPEGWLYKRVEEFGDVITGKTPSTSKTEYYGGNIPFVTIPDMHGKVFPLITEKTLTKVGAETQKNKYLPANAVIVSCIATVGLVNIAVEPCQTNQQINSVILYDDNDLYFFYESMKRIKALLDGVGSNGATMTNVNKTKFSNIKVLYPTEDLVMKYNEFCKPIFDKILALSKAMLISGQSRDRLLPKLMSGELEV
ncbi:MAG: restriction endonuclease subunit S [Spirochaetales bacterium]|nr:restriction endonuclease subunit S [Spirochaetales bacterium]